MEISRYFAIFIILIYIIGFCIIYFNYFTPKPIPIINPARITPEPDSKSIIDPVHITPDSDSESELDPDEPPPLVPSPVVPPKPVVKTMFGCANECQNKFGTFDDYYYRNCLNCVHKCEEDFNTRAYGYSYGYCDCANYSSMFYKGSTLCNYRKGAPPRGGHG